MKGYFTNWPDYTMDQPGNREEGSESDGQAFVDVSPLRPAVRKAATSTTSVESQCVASNLRVGFILDREIRDARISRTERVGPGRISHHVVVRSVGDLDAQLLGWLAEEQAMQAGGVAQRP